MKNEEVAQCVLVHVRLGVCGRIRMHGREKNERADCIEIF